MFNRDIHNRRSIRLKGYDYSAQGLYFITLCVTNKKHLFGKINKGKLFLNKYGEIAYQEWVESINIRKNISLGEFIIMPNHMHGIIKIDYQIQDSNKKIGEFKSPSNTIGAIIRGYKGATTKKINILLNENKDTGALQYAPNQINRKNSSEIKDTGILQYAPTTNKSNNSIWQRNYYEHIIKTELAFNNISTYIKNNPKRWGKDKLK